MTQEQLDINHAFTHWIQYIESVAASLTVSEVFEILMSLGFERALFIADDGVEYSLASLGCIDEIQDVEANQYPLQFVGGPPDQERWHNGTLVTWMIDAMLHDFAVSDGSRAMSIIADLEDIWNDGEETESEWDDLG
jgi:hypothetical protein